jgi:hypothetical protein
LDIDLRVHLPSVGSTSNIQVDICACGGLVLKADCVDQDFALAGQSRLVVAALRGCGVCAVGGAF